MISWILSRYHRMCMVFGFLFPRIWYSSHTSPHFSSRTQIHWGVYRATDTGAVYRINYAQDCVVLCFILVVLPIHYDDVIMGAVASQITSFTIVYSTVYSDADERKHQSSASLAFVRGIHRGQVNSAQMASNAENVSIWWRHHVSGSLRCNYHILQGHCYCGNT